MSDHPTPVPLPIADSGHYISPSMKSFGGLVPKKGGEPMRIRLVLGSALILDVPLTPHALAELAEDLVPYLPDKDGTTVADPDP